MSAELGLFGCEATRRFLRALYGSAPTDSLVEVRFRTASGMGQCFHRAAALERLVATITALASRTDVYVGALPRTRCAGGRRDLIDHAGVVWADCDTPAAITALAAFRPPPALVVASGSIGHRHVYWPLARPVSITAAESANRRLAAQLDADTGAVTNAATILRPPGTYSFKTDPPTPVVLERLDDERTTLYAATAGIAEDRHQPRC